MTRFEVNFMFMLVCGIAATTTEYPLCAIFYGLIGLWFTVRAIFPSLDRATTEPEADR